MPCGGINSGNVLHILRTTFAPEVHSSAGASTPDSSGNGSDLSEGSSEPGSRLQVALFEEKVAKLARLLGEASLGERVH